MEGRLGDSDLAAHGIGRDQGTLEIEPLDEGRNGGGLVGFLAYRFLTEHQPAVGRESRYQMQRPVAGPPIVGAARSSASDSPKTNLGRPASPTPSPKPT